MRWLNLLLTVVLILLLGKFLFWFVDWAFLDAVWRPDSKACRASEGACWGFIAEKHRFILFGTYPFDEHWRPATSTLLLLCLWFLSAIRFFWKPVLIFLWLIGLGIIAALMWGGVFGLPYVENERWGGLILTLLLTTFGLAIAFPLSILLALGRRSDMPAIRALCVGYIELVRGGLQAIPKGQYEAAAALGLGYWGRNLFVILPQALRIAVPPLVNTFIGFFKDTSLVLIIGLFDLLSTLKVSLNDPAWAGSGLEAYLFAAAVYFLFCSAMSLYSRRFERRPATSS